MDDDRNKLNQLITVLPPIDHRELDYFFGYLQDKYWTSTKELRGCSFCRYECGYYNERLDLLSCISCLNHIIGGMIFFTCPNNDVSTYCQQVISRWMKQHLINYSLNMI